MHRTGLKPAQVLSTIKQRGTIKDKQGIQWKVSDDVFEYLALKLAEPIVSNYKGDDFDCIASVASTQALNVQMAEFVAVGLGIPLEDKLFTKASKAGDIKLRQDRIQKYAVNADDDKANALQNDLDTNMSTLNRKLAKGDKLRLNKDFMPGRREFFSGMQQADLDQLTGFERILVIDDNLDSGWTLKDI